MDTPRGERRTRSAPVVEAAAFLLAAVAAAALASWLPDGQAVDALACIRFYLGHGCLP